MWNSLATAPHAVYFFSTHLKELSCTTQGSLMGHQKPPLGRSMHVQDGVRLACHFSRSTGFFHPKQVKSVALVGVLTVGTFHLILLPGSSLGAVIVVP